MCVRIETTEIGLAEGHQNLAPLASITRRERIGGAKNRIAVERIGVLARQHLLHLELWPWAAGRHGPPPVPDHIARLTPLMLPWIPHPAWAQLERSQAERRDIQARGSDFTRNVRVSTISPLFVHPHRGDLSGN